MTSRCRRRTAMGLALGSALTVAAVPAAEVPLLSGRVNDYAELIDETIEARITERLATHESRSGAQVAVLTVKSLGGEPVEEFSLRVAETWGLGRSEADDGVLFLVARDDRRMRIEVGYGLEAVLTDDEAGRILRDVVAPRFQAGDFSGGVQAGVEAVVRTLEGSTEVAVEAERLPASGAPGAADDDGLGRFALGVVSFFSLAAVFGVGVRSWIIFLVLTPLWGAFAVELMGLRSGLACLAAWVVVCSLVKLWRASPAGRRWAASRGGRISSRSAAGPSSGGWSFGGSSGGGFSGGGGRFGGGGATGGW